MALIKIILRPWRLAPGSQSLSLLALGLLIFLASFLVWLDFGLEPIVGHMEGRQVVTAFLSAQVADADVPQLEDSIRILVGAGAGAPASVAQETAVTKSEQDALLAKFKLRHPQLVDELDSLGDEKYSLIPRYVSVMGQFSGVAVDQIRALPGVDSVDSSLERTQQTLGAFKSLRWISRILVLFLGLSVVTVLFHLCRLNFTVQADAVSILSLLGANRFWVRLPAISLGLLTGLVSTILAFGLWQAIGNQFIYQLRHFTPALESLPTPGAQAFLVLLATGLLTGAFLGVLGSVFFNQRSADVWR